MWEMRDLPVLDAMARLYEEAGSPVRPNQIEAATGFDGDTVQKSLRALRSEDPPFFDAKGSAQGIILMIGKVTGSARRTVGAWPTVEGPTDRLASAFAEAASQESEPEKKGLLRRGAEFFGGDGKDVSAEVIAKVITQGM